MLPGRSLHEIILMPESLITPSAKCAGRRRCFLDEYAALGHLSDTTAPRRGRVTGLPTGGYAARALAAP